MIYVSIMGGLGNQMFQYAMYRMITTLTDDVKMDLSFFENYNAHNGYELGKIFNIKENIEILDGVRNPYWYKHIINTIDERIGIPINKNNCIYKTYLKYAYSLAILLFRVRYCRIHYVCDNGLLYDYLTKSGRKKIDEGWKSVCKNLMKHINKKTKKPICVFGYWNHKIYYEPILDKLHDEFTFKIPLEGKNKDLFELISNQQTCSVSLHIRRGDYVTSGMYLLKAVYYQRAVEEIEKRCQNPVFFVFSDDMEWVRENLRFLESRKATFVDWNKGEKSYIDMQLMSTCKHNITANSSFSQWSVLLNRNPEKIVIRPSSGNTYAHNPNLIYVAAE